MTDMIRVENLRKNFGEFCALDGVDMHVPGGSIYGLVGPNGAGKTTLLRHIMGIYRQDEGSVLVEGKPVYEQPDVKKDMIFITENGAYVNCRGYTMLDQTLDWKDVQDWVHEVRKIPGASFTMDTKEGFYTESRDPEFLDLGTEIKRILKQWK